MQKNRLFLLIFYTSFVSLFAQQMNGTFGSNHFGLNSLELNPSALGNSKDWMNVRVIGIHGFFSNNFAHIPGTYSLFQFIPGIENGDPGEIPAIDRLNTLISILRGGKVVGGDKVDGLNLNIKSINARAQIFAKGPGFTINQGRNNYGVGSNYKFIIDIRYVNFVLFNLLLDNRNLEFIANLQTSAAIQALDPDYRQYLEGRLKGFKIGFLHYMDIPFTYARSFTYGDNYFTLGGTIKAILPYGYEEYFVDDKPPLDENNIGITSETLLPGMSYFTSDTGIDRVAGLGTVGFGAGVDIGFTWYKMENQATHYYPHYKKDQSTDGRKYRGITMDYIFKIGFAITDIAFASISGRESVISPDMFADRIRAGKGTLEILKEFLEPTTRIIMLPTAANISFDYKLKKNWYLNATYIQHLHRLYGIGAPDLLSIAPRYETDRLEYAFPVSLLDWKTLQIGWMVRYKWLTVGMDDALSFINPLGVRNADMYLQVNVPIHSHPAMKEYNDQRAWRENRVYKNPLR